MNDKVNLLPCPFCGGEASIEEEEIGFRVVCYVCGIGNSEGTWTKEYAIETWNRRQAQEAPKAESVHSPKFSNM